MNSVTWSSKRVITLFNDEGLSVIVDYRLTQMSLKREIRKDSDRGSN